MAGGTPSFAEWQRMRASGKLPGPSAVSATPKKASYKALSIPDGLTGDEATGKQSPLNWLMDLVSRPLYGLTNIANQTFNEIEKIPETRKKGFEGTAGALGNILSSGVRGVFSDSEDDKILSGELMEKGTDAIGNLTPGYVDEEHNVNPIVKGVGGFAADMVFDPLTWVPGAPIVAGLKAAKGLATGAKDAERALLASKEVTPGTYAAADAAEKAVDDVVSKTQKFEKPTLDSLMESKSAKAADDLKLADDDPYVAKLDAMDDETFLKFTEDQTLDRNRRIVKSSIASPRGQEIKQGIDELQKSRIFKTEVAKSEKLARTEPLPFKSDVDPEDIAAWRADPANAEWLDDPDVAPSSLSWMDEVGEALESFGKVDATPAIKVQGKPVPLGRIYGAALQGDAGAMATMKAFHERKYVPSFARARQAGKQVDALGRLIDTEDVASTVETTVLDSVQALRRQVADSESQVVRLLGPQMVKALQNTSNSKRLDATITKLSAILGGEEEIFELSKSAYKSPFKTLLAELGVDPVLVSVGHKFQSTKNTAKPTRGVSDAARKLVQEKMVGPEADRVVQIAEDAVQKTVASELIDVTDVGKWGHRTKKGHYRTQELYGDGIGRRHREANTYFQYTTSRHIIESVANDLKREGAGRMGALTAAAKQRRVMESLRLAEKVLDENGVVHTIGVGEDRLPISFSQILETLSSKGDHNIMQYAFWNWGTAVPQTNLMEAVYLALKTGDRDAVKAALSKVETNYKTSDGRIKPMTNNLVNPTWGKNQKQFDLVETTTDLIMRKAEDLDIIVSNNAKAWQARAAEETYDITDKVLKTVTDAFEQEQGFGPAIEAIYNRSKIVKQNADDIGATQRGAEASEVVTKQAVPDADAANAERIMTMAKATEAAKAAGGSVTTIQRASVDAAQEGFEKVVVAGDEFVPGGDTRDFAQKIDQFVGKGLLSKLMPIVSRSGGNKLIHEEWIRGDITFRMMQTNVSNELTKISQMADRETMSALLANVRSGSRHPDPELAEVQDRLGNLWSQMFGTADRNGLVDNAFFREGNNVDHINSVFERHGVKQAFDMDAAEIAAKANGTPVLDEMLKQPQDWKIDDPADFISRAYAGFAQVQVHQTLAQTFVKMAKDLGATSKVPKKGYVMATNSGGSIMGHYMPQNLYIHDEVLRQMHVVDNLMKDSIKWDGPIKDFIDNVYRPVQDAWKYGMTLINPSHHMRNAVSDASLTFLANGVRGKKAYVAAGQAMAARNGYSNWDAIKFLQGMEELPNTGAVVAKGRHGTLTADGLQAAAASRGNLPTFKQLENLEEDGRGRLAESWQTLTNTKGAKVIGGVSEARDHYFRLAHFAQVVEQNIDNPNLRSMADVLDLASRETRKWHPDGTDLTAAERDIFRLIIPFYSWQRKAIPLIIEATVAHPGRVTAFPKAQFNIAVGMGLNPDTLADPFPEDQLFPEYLTDGMSGPQFEFNGKYYGINPGFAASDVLGDFVGADPGRTIMGSVSPLIRAPFELSTGAQVGTGAQINDTSDYVDSNVPILGPLSRISGHSVSGSVGSLLQGQGLDQQYQVWKGNKEGNEAVPLLNWLTGAGITPMSQPNQINYAEIQKRNAAKKEDERSGF